MKIRALKTIYGGGAEIRRDSEADVSLYRARQLIAKGYAVEVGPAIVPQVRGDTVLEPKQASNDNEGAAKGGSDPFPERPSGGQTGEEKPASSSRRGRPPKKQQSTSQEDDAE